MVTVVCYRCWCSPTRSVLTHLGWITPCERRKNTLKYVAQLKNIDPRSIINPFISFSGPFHRLSSWHSQRLLFSAGLCSKTFKQNAPCWQTDRQSIWGQAHIRRGKSSNLMYETGFAYGMSIWPVRALSSSRAVIQFIDTHTWMHSSLCLCTSMKHPQTAVPGAANNTVVLYFLQALWSHRIMQSLPHDKDVQPWGSNTDLLFPRQNKCHTSLTLQMPHEECEPGVQTTGTQLKSSVCITR